MQGGKPAFQSKLQQQPKRVVDKQQQQSSGSREFQPHLAERASAQAGQMAGGASGRRASPDGGSN